MQSIPVEGPVPLDQARRQLGRVVLPFWLRHGIDHEHGGFFTCFDNRGRRLLSTDKFTWSAGRFVWLLARAASLAERGLLDLDPVGVDGDELIRIAERGARFLRRHVVGADGRCAYRVTASGAPPTDRAEGAGAADSADGATRAGDERSIFADCFVAIGLAELARQTGTGEWLEIVDRIIERVTADVAAGDPPTAPYPLPGGFSGFGAEMILLNARLEQVRAHQRAGRATPGMWSGLADARTAVLDRREADTGLFTEVRVGDPAMADTLLARHRVPGHALEGVWMALEAGELLGVSDGQRELCASVSALCASGWDQEFGGLFRYTGPDGAQQPSGRLIGGPYEDLVTHTWSTKLWWVHSEAAYTTRLVARRHGDASAAEWFDRIWDYTLDTFPAAGGKPRGTGEDGEEWIQIRDRAGRPLDEVVALPVKDPFHISRNLMQLIELESGTNTTTGEGR